MNNVILEIPLAHGTKGFCRIYEDDYHYLLNLGVSPSWTVTPQGYVVCYAIHASGNHVQVARVLKDAGPGQRLRYKDGDQRNLCCDNLEIVPGFAIRHDRLYVTRDNELRR